MHRESVTHFCTCDARFVADVSSAVSLCRQVEASWNVMARAETGFRLSAKRMSPFKSAGAAVQSTAGSRIVRIRDGNAGYTMFRGSVKGTGYPLHLPVFPSLPLPCATVCHHISIGVYRRWRLENFSPANLICWGEGKKIPLEAWRGPEGSTRLRLPDFKIDGTWRW